MGRFRPGLSDTQAAAALQTISRGVMEDGHPPARPDVKTAFLAQVIQTEPGAMGYTGLRLLMRGPLKILMGLVGLVLLIACANMANLLTARASARHKEVAVRLALGAGRSRIIRQFLCESLLLSVTGAAGGFLIAVWATRALIAILSSTATLDLKPDWRVLLFTAAAAVVTGFLCGLAPALRATRVGVGAALKERAAQIHGSEGRFGFTRILLGGQVALSILLLAAAGLLGESLVRLLTENPGFDPQHLTVVSIDTSKLPQKGPALMQLYARLVERAKAMPGAESASLMGTTPLSNSGWNNFVKVPSRTDLSDEQREADINAVAPKLLQTLRVPLLEGRDFTESDNETSEKVTIISDNAARRWFPKGALGSYIGMQDGSQMRVVGVAGNSKYWELREPMPQTIFVPYSQWDQGGSIAIRTHVPPRETYVAFKEILRQIAPGAPIRTIKTMQQTVSESLATERLTAYLSVFFAALALLLTSIGLYGILAYSVSRRTSEIGVRMALGASPANVVWLVIREVMGHTTGGTVAGIAAVALSSKLIKSLLYGVHPNNPVALFEAVAALTLVCIAAAWIPARRASRLDPMVALREE
jgi:predicted permease